MSENTYFDMNRRSFLKSTAAAGALVLGTYFMGGAPRAMAGVLAKPAENAKRANLFIALRPDGMVEVTSPQRTITDPNRHCANCS